MFLLKIISFLMGYLITLHIKQIASKICVSSEILAEQILFISMSSHVKSAPLDIKKIYIIQNCFKYQSRSNENRIHKVFVWALS